MALTHDGLHRPLPPNRVAQLVGLLLVGVAIAAFTQGGAWICAGLTGLVIGALVFANQLGGVSRTRVTFSKLLVEDERPVMGFLVGPSKRRIPWEEFEGVEVAGGKVVAKGKSTTLELGEGAAEPDLQELARKIRDAAERYEKEREL
ncbi:MAG: hypothetical protein R3F59_33340 [Myxococcota bacterium]